MSQALRASALACVGGPWSAVDADFLKKAQSRLQRLVERSGILVFASHSNEFLARLCKTAMWIDHGTIKMTGSIEDVVGAYEGEDAARHVREVLNERLHVPVWRLGQPALASRQVNDEVHGWWDYASPPVEHTCSTAGMREREEQRRLLESEIEKRLAERFADLRGELEWEDEGSAAVLRRAEAPPPPAAAEPFNVAFFPTRQSIGYHTAMEYRFVAGAFGRPGPATAWLRMRHPLVTGEEPTPLQRVAIAADSGNGISGPLDFERFVFINIDLSIHLGRAPVGEWICLDSTTIPDRSGLGITDTALYDEAGALGRAAQTLLVAPRS